MKFNKGILFIFSIILTSCTTSNNNEAFIKKASGNYLYNSDEIIEVYFIEKELYLKWRGAENIKPLKVDDGIFYVKEMNEKIQFLTNPSNQQYHIVLVPKEKGKTVEYNYRKLTINEHIPSEYLKNNDYKKALEGYLAIKEKDSLDGAINEKDLNSLGYKALRDQNFEYAINIFKINVALYPGSSNVYDSLGEAFMKNGDTIPAIENYKKSLELDSGNKRAKEQIKKLENKN
jgi:hypothetical protein